MSWKPQSSVDTLICWHITPFHLVERHADLCVSILRSTPAKRIGQWMGDRSGRRCETMIGPGIIGLRVKALLLRSQCRK